LGSTRETIYDERLVRYLLGQMAEQGRDGLEDEYFADDGLFHQLRECEHWLIEEYLRDRLPADQRRQFEEQFSASLLAQDKVRIERALTKLGERDNAAAQSAALEAQSPESASPRSPEVTRTPEMKGGFFLFQTQTAAQRWLFALSLIVLLAGCAWLVVRNSELRHAVERLQDEEQSSKSNEAELGNRVRSGEQENTELTAKLNEERARTAELERNREKAEEQASGSGPTVGIASFLLIPDGLRGEGGPQVLKIPDEAKKVTLKLHLEPDDYVSYQAVLQDSDGHVIWSKQNLKAIDAVHAKELSLSLPGDLLKPRSYSLAIKGLTTEGAVEDAVSYRFQIAKR
jgi:hypothetical protein